MPTFLAEALTWPTSHSLLLDIRTAIEFHLKPMDVVEHTLDDERVGVLNRKLMRAWRILKDETCQRCGTVHWIGHSGNNYVEFAPESVTCNACAAQDEDEKEHKPKAGTTRFMRPKMTEVEGEEPMPLPGRAEYQQEMYEEMIRAAKKKEG